MIELVDQDGFFHVRTVQHGVSVLVNTNFKSVSPYRKKAERKAKKILQDLTQTVDRTRVKSVQNGVRIHRQSRLENDMDLIRIRNNIIYFEFRYDCPVSGTRKRCRKSTNLPDSRINRLKAQQMALEELNVLSHPPIPKPEPDNPQPSVQAEGKPVSKSSVSSPQASPGKIPKTKRSQSLKQKRTKRRRVNQVEEPESILASNVHTMNDLLEYYYTRKQYVKLTKGTKRTYRTNIVHYILPFFGHVPVADIDSDMIEDFEFELESHNLSSSFMKSILGTFMMLLRFAVKKKILQFCPHYTFCLEKVRKKPMYLTPDQRDSFLEKVSEHDALYFPLIQFAALTGVRMGEARSLTWGDVKFHSDNPSVRIHRTLDIDGEFKGTKTNQERTIPLHPKLVHTLRQIWMSAPNKNKDAFVFLNTKSKPHSKTTLHKVVVRNSIAAIGPRISFHGLRHTFATIVTNRFGVAQASLLLGHSDIKTTMIYYHGDTEVLKEAISGL